MGRRTGIGASNRQGARRMTHCIDCNSKGYVSFHSCICDDCGHEHTPYDKREPCMSCRSEEYAQWLKEKKK